MNRSSRQRVVLVAALMVALLVAAAVLTLRAPDAQAASNCTYYSNAAHTTIVGQFGFDCCNNRVAWGIKTSFKTCGGCFYCVPPPR